MSSEKKSFFGVMKSYNKNFWVASGMELFERWAWYGLFAVLALYLTGSTDDGGLGFTHTEKGQIMGIVTAILYLLPMITGVIADKIGYKISLIIASTLILIILAVPTLQGVVLMNRVPDPNDSETLDKLGLDRSAIDDAITVNVTGKRFFWIFEYPQFGIVTSNELVFPASKAVRINLRTEDVIHSFWLPKLAGKMDLMPGQENFLWFIANEEKIRTRKDSDGNTTLVSTDIAMPSVFNGKMRERIFAKQKFTDEFEAVGGLFYGQCAEYCGNSHAYMSFRALAQTDDDFDSWVKRFQNSQNPNLKK